MACLDLEQFLHERLPLTKAMQVSVVDIKPEGVTLSAPLAPNVNHQLTLFGGSASTLAITSAWSLVYVQLRSAGVIDGQLVIQRNSMEYDQPIDGAFTARSFVAQAEAWSKFMRMLMRKGRARITVCSVLEYQGQIAGRFEGDFVAIR